MRSEDSLVFSGIVPHPPIMVPEVGGDAIAQVSASIDAMAEFTRRVIAAGAETIVIVSPHAPLNPDAFVAYGDSELYGDFANFRAPMAQVDAPLDQDLLLRIVKAAAHADYEVLPLKDHYLDHGTTVPLYFLLRNGWSGRVVALGYSFLTNEDHQSFGACISEAVNDLGRRVAFVASGDLSHRLKPQAPAGYDPDAHLFDEQVVRALRSNAPERVAHIDPDLRRLAGECGYRSMLVALGATSELPRKCQVLNYEAPFGVGYLVAQLTNRTVPGNGGLDSTQDREISLTADGDALPALARSSVETYVLTGTPPSIPSDISGLLAAPAACFVSIKTMDLELRGCIGTVEPVKQTLAEELVANAINAATRDPRFPPVSPAELPHLRYSVDVLSQPEPATMDDLDPAIYGVVVEDESGLRRGLLLPDIEGVDTVTKQVEIATRKAGISPGEPIKLFRFRVQRFKERGF